MSKKIALLISNLRGGGAERILSNISFYIGDPELPIMMFNDIVEYPYCGKTITLPKLYSMTNWKVEQLIKKLIINVIKALHLERLYFLRQQVLSMKKYKREYQIDTTLSFLKRPNLCNILSKSKKAEKTVISVRNYIDVARPGELPKELGVHKQIVKLTKRHYKKADFVIAVSEPVRDRLISDFGLNPGKVKVIHNPLNIEGISNMSAEALLEEYAPLFNGTVLITVGRLCEQKGQHHMIRAFYEVKKAVPDAKLIILGQGRLREKLEALSMQLGLSDSVVFFGFQNNPYRYLKNSSIFVISSLAEGFPNILTEAMACGLPVISSDCPSGPREILAPDTTYGRTLTDFSYEQYGILCPVCDGIFRGADAPLTTNEKILANAMISLANDKERRDAYSKRGLDRAMDFDIKRIMPEYLRVLESV